MFEEARAMSGTLKLCNITQKELAERMGVSQSYVANKLRLLSFSPYLEKLITKYEYPSVTQGRYCDLSPRRTGSKSLKRLSLAILQ